MSDDTSDPVTEVQNLIATFNGYVNPTMQNLNTMTSGITSILNSPDITSDQTEEIFSMLAGEIQSNSFTNSPSLEYVSVEISQMSVSTNKQFFTTIASVFEVSSIISSSLSSEINSLIKKISQSTTSISSAEYATLWTSINSTLTDANVSSVDINTIKMEWDATLQLYFNLNTSNYMTKTLSQDIIDTWKAALMATLSSTYDLGAYAIAITAMMNNIFTDSGLTSTSGMSAGQFISACDDLLAYLSTYLTSAALEDIRTSIGTYISDIFFRSTTYADTMGLSAASTLTSSVSANFSVANLPFTPSLASSYKSAVLSSITSAYNFTSSQSSSIQSTITSYFNSITYSSDGMTAVEAYDLWLKIQTTITPFLPATTVAQQLLAIKTSFLNTLQTYILKNVSQILSYKTLIHNDGQEFLFTNPSTGALTFTGNYLSDWATKFLSEVGAQLTPIQSALLNSCLEDMMNSNNNNSSGVNGDTFIQIGCELLLWLSNFLSQTEINQIASKLQTFVVTFVAVYDYVENVDEALEVIAIIFGVVIVVIALVLITLVTMGIGTFPFVMTIYTCITLLVSLAASGAAVTAGASAGLANTIATISNELSPSYAITVVAVSGFLIFGGFGASGYNSIDGPSS